MVLNTAFQQIAGASALLAGVVLLTAGIPKALAPARFAGQITAYGITPASVSPILARTVSAAELLAGLLLIAGLAAPSPVRLAGPAWPFCFSRSSWPRWSARKLTGVTSPARALAAIVNSKPSIRIALSVLLCSSCWRFFRSFLFTS